MATVLVEQRLGRRLSPDDLAQALRGNAWCRELHAVRHRETFLAHDGRSMICVFDAPDVEAVRAVARRMGYPYERIWAAARVVINEPDGG